MSESRELLEKMASQPDVSNWFKGLFTRVQVEISDTGEHFTIVHHGDRAEVLEGFQGEKPNFVIPLETQNLRNLAGFFANGLPDAYAEYRIVKFMLQPCLKAALEMPVLHNPAFRAIIHLDTHWQEALLDPDGKEDERLTIAHVNNQWLVIPGYVGKPQRRLVMKPQQILDYQRRLFEADAKNSLPAWLELGRWYLKWRDGVSVAV